jgi:hypothetical protein
MRPDVRTCAVLALLALVEFPAAALGQAQTREELLRRFDLNSDGRIDETEAEQARARMRRERAATIQQSGIDPLTGRPRGEQTQASPTAEQGRAAERQAGDGDLLLVPGNPDGKPAAPARPRAGGDAGAEKPKETAPRTVPTAPRPSITTGGVRAGAPAVRPGYGATGPKADLNAGRPATGLPQARGLPATSAPPQRAGGPMGQPLRQGALPSTATPPRSTRPAAPRPGLFPQPPISAEDFGR